MPRKNVALISIALILASLHALAPAGVEDLHPTLRPPPRDYPSHQDRELTFHPGHYVLISDKENQKITELTQAERDAILEPHVTGVQKRYYWNHLETAFGVYDYSTIDADLAWCAANNRQLVLLVCDKLFFANSWGFVPAPNYIITDATYGTGALHGVSDQEGDGDYLIAKRWNKPVMDRFLELVRVLGERYDGDPNIEGINFMETATGYITDPDSEYTDEAYYNAILWRLHKAREYWPASQIFQSANGFPSWSVGTSKKYQGFAFFLAMGSTLKETNSILSGPDILPLYVYDPPNDYSITNYENFIRTLYRPLDNQVLFACSAQYDSFWWHTDGSTGSSLSNLVTMPDIFNAGFDEMRLDYFFWLNRPDDGITPNAFRGSPAATTVVDDVMASATVQTKFPRDYDLSERVAPTAYLHLPLDEETGALAEDIGPGANNGTRSNVSYAPDGRQNGAALFSAANAAITLPDIAYASDTSLLADNNTNADSVRGTLGFWFRTSAADVAAGDARQYLYHHDSGSGDALLVYIDQTGDALMLEARRGGGNQDEALIVQNFTADWADGAWHHCAFSFDYKKLLLYLDGKPQALETHEPYGTYGTATDRSYATLNPTGQITLGDNPLVAGENFSGAIDDLRLYNDSITITQLFAILETPGSPFGEDGGPGAIHLTWEDWTSDEDGFLIEQANAASGPWTSITSPPANATSYTQTGLTAEQQYFFRIRKTGGSQRNSEWVLTSGVAGQAQPPAAPDNVVLSNAATQSLTWQWNDNSSNEDGFYVYASQGLTAPAVATDTLLPDNTQYTVSGLTPNVPVTFQVSAYNSIDESSRTPADTAYTLALPPEAALVEKRRASSIDIQIPTTAGNPAGTRYRIVVDASPTPLYVQADGTLGSTPADFQALDQVTIDGLSPNTAYSIALLALNEADVATATGPSIEVITLPAFPAIVPSIIWNEME